MGISPSQYNQGPLKTNIKPFKVGENNFWMASKEIWHRITIELPDIANYQTLQDQKNFAMPLVILCQISLDFQGIFQHFIGSLGLLHVWNMYLVGGIPTPPKNVKVKWDYCSKYMGQTYIKCSKPPTRYSSCPIFHTLQKMLDSSLVS